MAFCWALGFSQRRPPIDRAPCQRNLLVQAGALIHEALKGRKPRCLCMCVCFWSTLCGKALKENQQETRNPYLRYTQVKVFKWAFLKVVTFPCWICPPRPGCNVFSMENNRHIGVRIARNLQCQSRPLDTELGPETIMSCPPPSPCV